jgi:excisionase family DNA binding protein
MKTETEELSVPIPEACRLLGVGPTTLRAMIADRRLIASRLTGRPGSRGKIVVHVSALKALLKDTRVTP